MAVSTSKNGERHRLDIKDDIYEQKRYSMLA